MDERLRFVARLLDGEKMAVLCREFDVSRKTGYKIFARYKDCGLEGLIDRSRRPYRHANRLPFQIETLIVRLKKEHSSWGSPKIREKIRRLHSGISLPAISTVHAVLDQHGPVTRGRRRHYKAEGTPLSKPTGGDASICTACSTHWAGPASGSSPRRQRLPHGGESRGRNSNAISGFLTWSATA